MLCMSLHPLLFTLDSRAKGGQEAWTASQEDGQLWRREWRHYRQCVKHEQQQPCEQCDHAAPCHGFHGQPAFGKRMQKFIVLERYDRCCPSRLFQLNIFNTS
jgi:hypothetical protein